MDEIDRFWSGIRQNSIAFELEFDDSRWESTVSHCQSTEFGGTREPIPVRKKSDNSWTKREKK